MALSIILDWLVSHLSTWLVPLGTLILGALGARAVVTAKSQSKLDAAQVSVDHAQMQATQAKQQAANAQADAKVAQAQTDAIKQAVHAETAAAAITDDKLDAEGKSRGLLRD